MEKPRSFYQTIPAITLIERVEVAFDAALTQFRSCDSDHLAWISEGVIRTENHAHQGALPHKSVILKPMRDCVATHGFRI